MESAGPITLLYIFFTLPKEQGVDELPWGNWTMVGCFVSQTAERLMNFADQSRR
jgi:3-oxo-5-alpha-steroid 4-dehydrogenase 1